MREESLGAKRRPRRAIDPARPSLVRGSLGVVNHHVGQPAPAGARIGAARLKGLLVCKLSSLCTLSVSMFTAWSVDGSLSTAARETLRLDGEPAQLTALINQWAEGDFSALPPIEVLDGSVLPGAAGAAKIRDSYGSRADPRQRCKQKNGS